ncbi:MAG: DNA methyltransferase [Candidatus Eremiobacterota bacterium]
MARKQSDKAEQQEFFKSEKKNVPKMPEGYYSGDKPNPNLKAFVEEHIKENPCDPESDDYNVPAFDKPIETTKATAIYNMHTYWSKKPHDAIRQYIRHYTKEGDLVLDPFCGSGGTALAALMEGRKAIAIDRSPAATFITKNYCTPVDVEELKEAFEELKAKVKQEIDWLYETKCERCGGKATTAYTVYSQVFRCPRCYEKIPLFDCVEVESKTQKGKDKKIKVCPYCYKMGILEEISTRDEKFGAVPVLVSYICEGGCKPARGERKYNDEDEKKREYFEKYDKGKIREIEEKEIPYWYPEIEFPDNFARWKSDLRLLGIKKVLELFTKRNLWTLAMFLNYIELSFLRSELLFIFQSNILNATKMQQYREAGGGFAKGTYYIPQIFIEREQLGCLSRKARDIISAKEEILSGIAYTHQFISTQSSLNLSTIQSNTIDYIFTDPPYSGSQQYGELNFVWEAWLNFDTNWHDEEIIVNEVRGKTEKDWENMMRQAMKECYRVLKPGRWLSLCYHDTSEGTWSLIQDIMAEAGFIADRSDSALFIDTGQKSYNQLTADKVTKRDLVINFRKLKPSEIYGNNSDNSEGNIQERVRKIIKNYLTEYPGTTKDHIYDEAVSLLVRSGKMEPHDFDKILSQVAEKPQETGNLWFLKESEETIIDKAESQKEDKSAEKVASFIKNKFSENPELTGIHYSDLFEHYIYSVKDKPRRPLSDWLIDYFYKTEEGLYRLSQSEEEERIKAEGRKRGISRKIRRYISYIEQGLTIPERERPAGSTLSEWIRHCKRSGLYEQGKLLYEKGGLDLDSLSEEIMVNVEEDYQVCCRMADKGKAEKKKKKKSKGQPDLFG